MKKLTIKNAMIIDPSSDYHRQTVDIYIEDGVIKEIGKLKEAGEIFDVNSYYVSPGFIDIHVHCYHGKTKIGIDPYRIGVKTGVTTLIDAGTSGADTIDDFYSRIIKNAKERIYILLNTASDGLKTLCELSKEDAIDEDKIVHAVEKYKDQIVGLKARASSSVLLDKGIEPIKRSKVISNKLGLPLVVHIGNAPPSIDEVIKLVDGKDVITHCYHNKPNGLFDSNGYVLKEVSNAIDRGVKFDIGHGSSSFSFDTYENAKDFMHDFISSDIYDKNIETVVKSLVHVMNKTLALGMSLDDVIGMVTSKPAKHFKLQRLGSVKKDYLADFTVYKTNPVEKQFTDSVGSKRIGTDWIEVKYGIVNGNIYKAENGGSDDIF